MNLPILTRETAPAASRPILDGIEADLGFVPNLAATIAASPTLLAGFDGLRRAVGDSSFDPVRREIAGVAVGVAVGNAYGVAFHSTVLGRLGVGQDDIDAMRRGAEPRDDVHAAVYAFARALVIDRGAVSSLRSSTSAPGERKRAFARRNPRIQESVVRQAVAAGLGPANLLQLVTECVFATLVGLVDNLAGGVELDEPLRPQAWK